MALGAAYCMAPEQLQGKEVDHRADQFALAVVLYELLTGQVPVGGIEPPRTLRRSIPEPLSAAVMKSLAGDPQKRFADMSALAAGLSSTGSRKPSRTTVVAAAAPVLVVSAMRAGSVAKLGVSRERQDAPPRQSSADVRPAITQLNAVPRPLLRKRSSDRSTSSSS